MDVLSALQGIRVGSFPTRYLGLPLNPARITFATLQPFIEKITNKLHAWTASFSLEKQSYHCARARVAWTDVCKPKEGGRA